MTPALPLRTPAHEVESLSLEDRAALRAAHFARVAKYAEAGIPMTLAPDQLRDTAQLLRALAARAAVAP